MKAPIEQALRELADKIAAGLKDVEEGRLLTDEEVVSGFCAGERC